MTGTEQTEAWVQALVAEGLISDPDSPKGRLLGCAAQLFRDKGYERTTVRDLAAAVGIQSGSLFHHFRTKEDILCAVMVETIHLNTARLRTAVDAATDCPGRLRGLIRAELESINGATGAAMTVLVYEWRSLSEANQALILKLRDIYERLWLDVLEEAHAAGLVRADPFILRRLLTGALSWTVTWFKPQGPMGLDGLAEEVMGMLGATPG